MTEDDIPQEAIDADRCIALTESGDRCSRPARDDGFCYQHDEEDETILDAITADGGKSDLVGELATLTEDDEETTEGNGAGSEVDEGEEASAEEVDSREEEEQAESTEEEAESTEEEQAESTDEEEAESPGEEEAESTDQGEADSTDEAEGESAEETDTADDEGAETSEVEGDGSSEIETIRGRIEENTAELVGRPVDGVASIHAADDDGWVAVVELVERTAVPDTQDIIGRYEVQVDGGGNVSGYDRLERYRRGDTKAFE